MVELFEARKPRETAVIAEINCVVKYGEVTKGMRKLSIQGDGGVQKGYSIPRGVHINVQKGERVRSGDPLMHGPNVTVVNIQVYNAGVQIANNQTVYISAAPQMPNI